MRLAPTIKTISHQLAWLKKFTFKNLDKEKLEGSFIATSARADILIVAPGESNVPAEAWGAVEIICYTQYEKLIAQGISTALINSWKFGDWIRALHLKPKIIICHYDDLLLPSLILKYLRQSKLIAVSHNPFAGFPELWSPGFLLFMRLLRHSDKVVALSPRIALKLSEILPLDRVVEIPNGINVSQFRFSPRIGNDAICLGRIEERKRQMEIAALVTQDSRVRFAGPVSPQLKDFPDRAGALYLGEFTRQKTLEQLTEFRALILVSFAEADALVLHEARAAGLCIFATRTAMGSIKDSWTGVHLISDNLSELHNFDLLHNCTTEDKVQIRKEALQYEDDSVNFRSWRELIDELLLEGKSRDARGYLLK